MQPSSVEDRLKVYGMTRRQSFPSRCVDADQVSIRGPPWRHGNATREHSSSRWSRRAAPWFLDSLRRRLCHIRQHKYGKYQYRLRSGYDFASDQLLRQPARSCFLTKTQRPRCFLSESSALPLKDPERGSRQRSRRRFAAILFRDPLREMIPDAAPDIPRRVPAPVQSLRERLRWIS